MTVSVDEAACRRLLDALAQEDVSLTYLKIPVEYGRVGRKA